MPPKVNDVICDRFFGGRCNLLLKNPKNYLATVVASLVFNYLIPLILIINITVFTGNIYFSETYIVLFSPVFPGIASFYLGHATMGLVVIGVVMIVVDIFYLKYMIEQLGAYVIVPIIFEVLKWTIVLFFQKFIIIAILLSLVPFMTLAVGAHFIINVFAKKMFVVRL